MRSVKHFSKITSSLTNLLNKTTKFAWSDKCEEAFQELKRQSTTNPFLTLLIKGKECTIYSDSSKNKLGWMVM